ncbi:hypothetical protein [Kamptonema sp. UHCC 0994]|nr:hypothetical protein [Kamptonema sp. UHCC 0994]
MPVRSYKSATIPLTCGLSDRLVPMMERVHRVKEAKLAIAPQKQ